MDNVLIAIDTSEFSFWMAYYAIGLTRRVTAKVSILMVKDGENTEARADSEEWIGLPEKRLESLLAEEYSDQTHIDYYVAQGSFEEEVLRFIKENKITMLFLGQPPNNSKKTGRFMEMLERISRQTGCRIEVVQKVPGYAAR